VNDLNEIFLKLLWVQLQALGLFKKRRFSIDDLKRSGGVQAFYDRWLQESLAVLTRNHYLSCAQELYTVQVTTPLDSAAVWREWNEHKQAWLEAPRTKGEVRLAEATLRALPEILTGKIPATAVIFPDSSMAMVEGVYKNNPVADYYNEVLADTVLVYLEERLGQDPAAQIRIIEIGAGTGGTSAAVFRKIKPYRNQIAEYCYTDISKAFLLHAEAEYRRENHFLNCRIFNAADPTAAEAEIMAGEYDLAIAANVLHATANIRQTLRNVKATLKRNGLLLLNEISENLLFTHLTFGLLEGWWLYEDAELRIPGCPGLYPRTWRTVLEDEGFRSVLFPAQEAHQLGQQIIVAESDGVVRRRKQPKPLAVAPNLNQPDLGRIPLNRRSLKRSGTEVRSAVKVTAGASSPDLTGPMLEARVRALIKEITAAVLKMEEQRIAADRSFSEYGVDSIVAVNLVNLLNGQFQIGLPPTIVFDYNNLDQLTKYLIQNHRATLTAALSEKSPLPSCEPQNEVRDAARNQVQEEVREQGGAQVRSQSQVEVQAQKENSIPVSEAELILENSDYQAPPHREPIAIIGMSGRFAKSKNIKELWEHLSRGDDLIETASRWNLSDYYPDGSSYCRQGSFVEDIDCFDPLFFNISGQEATFMDPQQRLFLEESWTALEDAGYAGVGVSGCRCGVYVGCSGGDYAQLFDENPPPQAFWGNAGSVIPARIAYYLDLHGPAIAIDTACSSSLVAVHLACQGLWSGETELALAGGVFIQATPAFYLTANRAGMLSPTGHCHSFDERADGFVPGEGVGVVVLKRLKDAIAAGDHIYGVISGSGINQDGNTNGITAPSAISQERLERYVYDTFRIDPGEIQMVEAHGTGTRLGDPIEYQALTRSFRAYTDRKEYCAIGSIKSNLGHTAAAAGVTGLIKVLLFLGHKQIPPSPHFKSGNPHIRFEDSPFYVNTSLKDWEVEPGSIRRAVISSFGFSGTNAHLVLEEAPRIERRCPEKPGYLIGLSARTSGQLKQQARQLLAYCESEPGAELGNISYTLLLGRKHFQNRLGCVVRSIPELITLLQKWREKGKTPQIFDSQSYENDRREQPALQRYGHECLRNCNTAASPAVYWECLSTVAELYVQGYQFDFEQLFRAGQHVKIPLPTYPFARERYWVSKTGHRVTQTEEPGESSESPEPQEPFELMTFEEIWLEQALPGLSPAKNQTVVCFLSNPAARQGALEAVQALDRQATIVFISQSDGNQSDPVEAPPVYSVSAGDRHACQRVFQSIKEKHPKVDAIFYLWALEDGDCIQDCSNIVHLLQALNTAKLNPERLLLAGQYRNALERSYLESWIGFERSLGLVLPRTQVAVICQAAEEPDEEISIREWLPKLWAELQTTKTQSVWYQAGKRNVCQIRPLAVPDGEFPLRAAGTYLITGGCGGLGFLFALRLADRQPVNLILSGRSAINDAIQAKISNLEALGSRVRYIQADISDAAQMKEALKPVKEAFGSIHGVIHAAGIEGNQSIFDKDLQSFSKVLAPKIRGALVLDELLAEEPLDFVAYFASSAAILGDFGSCDYAVGNRFLMAYAQYRNSQSRPGRSIAINWPLWRDGGMAVNDDANVKMYLNSSGQRFLEKEEGIAIFERILAHGNAQYLVLAGQPGRVNRFLGLDNHQAPPLNPRISSLPGQGRRAELRGLNLEQCLEWDLKELISKLLKISRERIGKAENLADFGFDSLSLAEYAAGLTNHYGIAITPALFFQCSSLEKLVQYFLSKHREIIRDFYREEAPESTGGPGVLPAAVAPRREADKSAPQITVSAPEVPEPIAIIGMSGRFPSARNVDEMWEILVQGRDVVTEVPPERNFGPDFKWKCGWLPGVSEFDPLFFEISPKEAETIDPKQRLLLQETWRALEDAGYGAAKLSAAKIGMFVGVEASQYKELIASQSNITANHDAILAARLAYFLNLRGPNMAINTACSSGLVAAHQACLSLRNHECDTAIAAGANLLLLSSMFTVLNQAGMLSEDSRCYAFDRRANGLVPGEAVAAVVLKRLTQARADGDRIYAVIKGNGINYDGKTNGITAPGGRAQTELLKEVYQQYQVNPEEIEYIVTHGTGTKLGDPVEINALHDAFKAYTNKQGFSALTSTKTNFGHSFAASGLVSLISLVLALRYQTIPVSLHCEQENDYINWKESPFYVNKTNKPWLRADRKVRTGAVSAFGMSGTNVHMVVQSYAPEEAGGNRETVPYFLLALSAKTKEALAQKIKAMIEFLQKKDCQDRELAAISYTLLEGRQHFNYRTAIVVKDCEAAVCLWQRTGGKERLPNLFQGIVAHDFTGPKVICEYAQDLIRQSWSLKEDDRRYQEILLALADLYCQGYDLRWDQLFGTIKPQCVSLPTYPFARESYWAEQIAGQSGVGAAVRAERGAVPHPLLQQNTSDLFEQRFSSTFSGEEFFLADHRVKGEAVLPGTAYLEMARAAVEASYPAASTRSTAKNQSGLRLKNVVWVRPLTIGEQPVRVHIGLYPDANGELAFEIYSEATENGNEPIVHSQGSAAPGPPERIPPLDLPALQAQCNHGVISAAQCYQAFWSMGLQYGPGHRGIERIYAGAGQALAKLVLPDSVSASLEQYWLHPGILDSALQTVIGLLISTGQTALNPYLPFALRELEIFDKFTSVMWAFIRVGTGGAMEDTPGTSSGVQQYDLDLCDDKGNVCVRIKGFSTRILADQKVTAGTAEPLGSLMLYPVWQERPILKESAASDDLRRIVILGELNQFSRDSIEAKIKGARCLALQSQREGIGERFQDYTLQVLAEIQNLFTEKSGGKALVQIILPNQEEGQLFTGLAGLLKTGRLENPQLFGQLIEIEPDETAAGLIKILQENSQCPDDDRVRYHDGKRLAPDWSEAAEIAETVKIPWKERGVYLISGGAGGLGLIFAKEIAAHARQAVLILAGRSALDAQKQAELQQLRDSGVRIEYRQADVAQKEDVINLVQSIQAEFGGIDGVIHSAGVVRDNLIIKKTIPEMQAVLAPKVSGVINLDQATRDLPLDLFIIFSSAAAVFGNTGQADYAAANAFMDAYALYRSDLAARSRRHGQTLSLNWPLWQAGGMRVAAATEQIMRQNTGMVPLSTAIGVRALYQGITSAQARVMVLAGEARQLRATLLKRTRTGAEPLKLPEDGDEKQATAAPDPDSFREKAVAYLKKQLAAALNLPAARLEADTPLEKYGIDSIMVMQLTNHLEKSFGLLPKTLFFEYQNITALTGYFLTNYRDRLIELTGVNAKTEIPANTLPQWEVAATSEKPAAAIRSRPRFATPPRQFAAPNPALDIAIIGVSGRYPQADNLAELWQILREGKDCIVEIPPDRWDHDLYFDADPNQPGKVYSKWGGFINDADRFDPLFFNISPVEAEIIDPQERLFLECVYATLEDAGYTRQSLGERLGADGREVPDLPKGLGLGGNVGVYVGVMYEEYQLYGAEAQLRGRPVAASGNPASIANRVSYFCNFNGPSLAVDTMCSSSLTAIHLACQSLRQGGCEAAIAGGVNLSLHPNKYLMLSQGKFASSKGRCESFGRGGDGYVPGEGVGAVLLKPLAQAIAAGDHIYGVIKGTAINHGGKTNGYTVPNPNAQAEVIGRAFLSAGVDPRTVSYIEAHGTGTYLGDPIEIAGLTKTFQAYTQDKQFCAIGSIKSNLGHCESAAGIAGLTKVLLQLKYGQLVPSIHAETLNPNIDFANTPFRVQRELTEWRRPLLVKDGATKEYPRVAGISAFGAGGSNAHLLIAEYVPPELARPPIVCNAETPALIVLSAKNEERLRELARQLAAALNEGRYGDSQLAEMAYTLQVGREAMEERLALPVGSVAELAAKLTAYVEGREGTVDLFRGQVKRNQETLEVFAADPDLAKIIEVWIAKGKYAKLLDLWVKGLAVDWERLYSAGKPRRISMPTYPFAKERYWLFEKQNKADGPVNPETRPAAGVAERRICYLQKQWEFCPEASTPKPRRSVLILATPETAELASELSQHFDRSRILDGGDLEAEPGQPEDFWRDFNGWVDLIGCGKQKDQSPLWLKRLQALVEFGKREELMLLGVTRGLESYQNPTVNLAGAARAGLYRMLQSEYGQLRSRHMDTDGSTDTKSLARQIASEFFMESDEPEICYRAGKRYRSRLGELPEKASQDRKFTFPEEEVLWITGGTRGIGYLCARHWVTKYGVKRLVLTGRESIPPREEWDACQKQDSALAKKIKTIRDLEAQGAEVRVLSVCLTDADAVQKSLQMVKSTMGPIGGVIHCAGTDDRNNPAFIRKSLAEIQQVTDPKVAGVDSLLQSFKAEPLRFLVLFSSVAAIIPDLASGQSSYAMANAYMDYVAGAYARECPIVSIQWPSWKETGMGEAKSRAYQRTGLLSHTNQEGLQLLEQVIADKLGPVVLPAVVNPALWNPEQLIRGPKKASIKVNGGEKNSGGADRGNQAGPLHNATREWLAGLFARELKMDPAKLEADREFPDYGVDSILLAQILRAINQQLATDLDPSILLEQSTIESLAAWLARNQADRLAERLNINSTPPAAPTTEAEPRAAEPEPGLDSPPSRNRPGGTGKRPAPRPLDIAVVGLACRFPGADTPDEYWKLLAEGRTAIRAVPRERWGYENQFYAGLLDGINRFDAKFFLIPENDVRAMDPQALAVLEETLKLWYQAGYSLPEIKGKPVGVYLGGRSQHRPDAIRLLNAKNPIVTVGQNYLAANVSQFFDLRGPSIVVDTACSSALTAMNMAIHALNNGEIEAAVVGGVSLLNSDDSHRLFQQRGILSPGPGFHIFDQRARGIVLGEGVGLVLLKTVAQALEDGDRIYAVVKGLAINNDGRTAGPATPNLNANKEVLQTALTRSGRRPEEIAYIEANGSGSEVTDLLELKAIQSVYRSSDNSPLALGSIKPNIGHPLCAEGIAGFIKVALMLENRQFVPFCSGEQPMTHYDIAASPFYFYRKPTEWTGMPRIAAINCFADGGTNVHLILEAWEETDFRPFKRQPNPPPQLNRQEFGPIATYQTPPEEKTQELPGNGVAAKVIWEMFN
jgi:acyl transferase domain-containing protein/NAD(P)-dependent dehydrogenase (short-subunit alcohol dehydrogenase family)/acyl carrier protein/ubiquinone/menaquinone biosynthesis C-methylase UbiE